MINEPKRRNFIFKSELTWLSTVLYERSYRDVLRNSLANAADDDIGLLVLKVCLICFALLIVKVIFVITVFFLFLLCVSTIFVAYTPGLRLSCSCIDLVKFVTTWS